MNLKRTFFSIPHFLLFCAGLFILNLESTEWKDLLKEPAGSYQDTATPEKDVEIPTQTVLKAIPEKTSVYSEPVIFIVNVVSNRVSHNLPTGTIQLEINQQLIETKPLSNGGAKFKVTNLSTTPIIQHSVVAIYSGDNDHTPSRESLNYTVFPANTTATFRSSPNPSLFGQGVDFIFDIKTTKPAMAIPTGNIKFRVDGGIGTPIKLDEKGRAIFSTSELLVGKHTITAFYEANESFNGALINHEQIVNKANSNTQITSSNNPSSFGQDILIKAKITSERGRPSGQVQFSVDGSEYEKPISLDNNGEATLNLLNINSGNHTIDAQYLADSNYENSLAFLNQKVDAAVTKAEISSSNNPAVYSQPVELKAKITSTLFPVGYAQFKVNGLEYGQPVLLSRDGQASMDLINVPAGSHIIEINYFGNDNFLPSTATMNQKIEPTNTTATFQAWPNPSIFGQPVQFIAQIDSAHPGTSKPQGTVNFQIDGKTVKGILLDQNGKAMFISSKLDAGQHVIKANFDGTENFKYSTIEIHQQIDKAPTVTRLTSSHNPTVFGQDPTFKAYVSSEVERPVGQVQFLVDGTKYENPEYLNHNGEASITIQNLSSGNHNIEASYLGEKNFEPSNVALYQKVEKAKTLAEIVSSKNPASEDDPLAITIRISFGNQFPPGSVQFKVDGKNYQTPIAIDQTGIAVINMRGLTAGSHQIVVEYLGSENHLNSQATLIQKIETTKQLAPPEEEKSL